MTQAEKYQQETGILVSHTIPESSNFYQYHKWLETKADNLEAQIIGMHAELANAEKERDEYREKAFEFAELVAYHGEYQRHIEKAQQFIIAERDKERGQ